MVATTTVPSKKGPKTTPRHNQTTSGVPRGLPLVSTARPSFSWIGCDCPGDGFIREGICHLTAKEKSATCTSRSGGGYEGEKTRRPHSWAVNRFTHNFSSSSPSPLAPRAVARTAIR